MSGPEAVEAVTLDLFNTLIFHRDGRGRGHALVEYLESRGLSHAPWEHGVLYDVFEEHDLHYSPVDPAPEKAEYLARLADRVFDRLQIDASAEEARRHAPALWQILGPSCFGVFPDVVPALGTLRELGYPLALISNWQSGVRHFCTELGLAGFFDHILGSADVGAAKPDALIFEEASARLGVEAARVLHVGDTLLDDYRGGEAAGVQVLLIDRKGSSDANGIRVIRSLAELPELLRDRQGHAQS